MFADLDWFFQISWTHIMWKFYFQTQKSLSTWETIMSSYLPCKGGGGIRWSGASWSSVIHSGFTNMFQIKTFFPKLKTSDSMRKLYVGSSLPQKRQGWCYRLHPDLDWFFPVSRVHSMWKFSSKTKIRKLIYISSWRLIYPTVRVGVGRSVASPSQVIHSSFSNIFQLKIFSQSQKFGMYAKTRRFGSFPPQKECGWGNRLNPDLKLSSEVLETSVQNFRSPAQSARLWPFLVVIVILFLF